MKLADMGLRSACRLSSHPTSPRTSLIFFFFSFVPGWSWKRRRLKVSIKSIDLHRRLCVMIKVLFTVVEQIFTVSKATAGGRTGGRLVPDQSSRAQTHSPGTDGSLSSEISESGVLLPLRSL